MKVGDVMTPDVRTIDGDAPLKEAATVMVKAGISGLPVVDDDRKVVGIITEADFVTAEANRSWGRQRRRLLANFLGEAEHPQAKTVADAMTTSPHTIDRGSSVTEAARKMTDLRVKRLPVVTPDGTLEGIISRADVMGAFARSDEELRREIVDDVLIGVLQLDPATVQVDVTDGLVVLTGSVVAKSETRLLEELAVRVEGVISVDSNLSWSHDDTKGGSGPSGLL
ncbi:MAG: CBS domain-containing protein [Actinomycetia bacterium]|nr:CBS domain-containing protein [Actinomycetes bacterium]